MKKYIVELIGTFFLVLTVLSSAVLNSALLTPLAIGSVLMVMIYAGGHISGGHYNPAVTVGVLIRGGIRAADAGAYVLAQLAGAVLAVFAAKVLYAANFQALGLANAALAPASPGAAATPGAAPVILAEFLFTFALVYVVLNVATAKDNGKRGFYGLAIGFTVLSGAVAVGGVSGGAFNPAVATGVSTLNHIAGAAPSPLSFATIWQHLAGEFLAAIAAGLLFNFLNADQLGDERKAAWETGDRG
ncbi:MAG: aquaporin family protein [Puniceicoccales bacterium]|jgi:aquaporin Z|nr:aquaporin family protein [Puniceicoccales bacterium]